MEGTLSVGKPIDGTLRVGKPIDGTLRVGTPIDGRLRVGRPIVGMPTEGTLIVGRPIEGKVIEGRPIEGTLIVGTPAEGMLRDGMLTVGVLSVGILTVGMLIVGLLLAEVLIDETLSGMLNGGMLEGVLTLKGGTLSDVRFAVGVARVEGVRWGGCSPKVALTCKPMDPDTPPKEKELVRVELVVLALWVKDETTPPRAEVIEASAVTDGCVAAVEVLVPTEEYAATASRARFNIFAPPQFSSGSSLQGTLHTLSGPRTGAATREFPHKPYTLVNV